MSVPSWKRTRSSSEYVNKIAEMNDEIRRIVYRSPTKYRVAYGDELIKSGIHAYLSAYRADKTRIRKTDSLENFDSRIKLLKESRQIYGLLYLNDFDHFVKEQLHIEGYGRYNDDIYLIHEDPVYLKKCLRILTKMLRDDYCLEVNVKKTGVRRIGKDSIVFLKKRFIITATKKILIKSIKSVFTKRRRTIKKQSRLLKVGLATTQSLTQSYQSWRSGIEKTNSFKTLNSMDKLFRKLVPV